MKSSDTQSGMPLALAWNALVIAALLYEAVEKAWELVHHLSAANELDAVMMLIIAVNVFNHAARAADIRRRYNRIGLAADGAGLLLAGIALYFMWRELAG